MHAQRNLRRLTVRRDLPEVAVGILESTRHRNAEHPPLPPGEEMRRLPHVGTAGIDVIVGPDRDVELLLLIAIVVTDQERARAVRVVVPALERARDTGAGAAARLGNRGWNLRRHKNAAGHQAGGAEEPESVHCCFSLSLVGFAVFALRSACSALYSSSLKNTTFIQACAISSTVRSP